MKFDLVSVVDAVYRGAPSQRLWLKRILSAIRPRLDRGLGVGAFAFELRGPAPPRIACLVTAGCPAGFLQAVHRLSWDQDFGAVLRRSRPVSTTSQLRGRRFVGDAALREAIGAFGVRDTLNIRAVDRGRSGLVIFANLARLARVTPRDLDLGSQLSAHLLAALQLRRGLEAPKGREALRKAALAIERASTLRRAAPEEASGLWRVLIQGRWSVIDQFDRDGRRYLLARENGPTEAGTGSLSEREQQILGLAALGHSNKLIAYELDLSASTVATHLASAARKLGAVSRGALLQACALSRDHRDGEDLPRRAGAR